MLSSPPPPPPSISPRQMNLLRIVASMAWSDGQLAQEEVDIMLAAFSTIFSKNAEQQQQLQHELRDYVLQNIPLDELVPRLESDEERQLVLKLGYQVIASSARNPDEPHINADEAKAYRQLVKLLNLPAEVVTQMEDEVDSEIQEGSPGLVVNLTRQLQAFIDR
jgi:hypothetical protein